MIKLLLADDHPMFREGLRECLSRDKNIRVKDEAGSGKEVLEKVRKQDYDVIVLDISLPDINGLEILRQIKDNKPDARVLILSMYSEDQFACQAFKLGASGYLPKTHTSEDLIDAICTIAKGGKFITSKAAEKLITQINTFDKSPSHNQLSFRENQVFLRIARGKTIKQISSELGLSISTINTLRYRIFKKMSLHSNIEIARYAIKNKLID